ncbi:MAG: hypothetical protein IT580_11370 [Verrucomicrobiales bacterium]|nr:hypothetical protein [Verrucomicrobiales bacterium]
MGTIIGLVFGLFASMIAAGKGFKALRWILALGVIGFITVICLSSAQADGIGAEEAQRRAARANSIGAWLAWINVAIGVVVALLILAN